MSGRLPNAPLVYACASVRFEHIGDLSKRVDELQAVLREDKRFPLYGIQRSMTVAVDQNGPRTEQKEFYIFNAADRSAGFLLTQDSLFFQALDYATFESSIEEPLCMMIDAIKAIYGTIFFTFVGNRYIDWIRPEGEVPLARYVGEQFLPVKLNGMTLLGKVGLQQFVSSEKVTLAIRHFGAQGHRPLPDDLIFSCSQLKADSLLNQQLTENQLIVDTDASLNIESKELVTEELLAFMRKVHEQASAVFHSPQLFSDEARQFWREQS